MKSLPNTTFFSWAGSKHAVMDRLGIPRDQFVKWDMPPGWINAMVKEARKRK
jgi:hypothetical protein